MKNFFYFVLAVFLCVILAGGVYVATQDGTKLPNDSQLSSSVEDDFDDSSDGGSTNTGNNSSGGGNTNSGTGNSGDNDSGNNGGNEGDSEDEPTISYEYSRYMTSCGDTPVESVQVEKPTQNAKKVFNNGQLLIEYNGVYYNTLGIQL